MCKWSLKITPKTDRMTLKDENSSSECGDMGIYNKINNNNNNCTTVYREEVLVLLPTSTFPTFSGSRPAYL